MSKGLKMSLVVAMGAAMMVAGTPVTANAAKTKVISTTNIAQRTVHGRQGNLYSSAKLSKVTHKMKNYRYTTWTASKKAVVKKNAKKVHVTYIKSGAKHGWIYSRYLTNGKAPFNKAKAMKNDLIKTNQAAMASGSSTIQDLVNDVSDYSSLGDQLSSYGYGNDYRSYASEMRKTQAGLLNIYDVYKGRFSRTQNDSLAAMAKKVDALEITKDDDDAVGSTLTTFSNTLGTLIGDL